MPPALSLRWSGLTDKGRFRPGNEDAFLALKFDAHEARYLGKVGEDDLSDGDFVFAVSDGMGGANAGEFASKIAVEKITRLLPASFTMRARGLDAGQADVLGELFSRIHAEIVKLGKSYEECAGMGATLTLCWFSPGWMYFAHIGDSRLYFLPAGGGLQQLSHDHSHVGWLRRQGKLNEREARSHPRKHMLQQALSADAQMLDPHIGAVGCSPGDRFVLVTDGVVDGLWDRALEEAIREPSGPQAQMPPGERLVRLAIEGGSKDNATALVVEIPADAL